jgi:hypothetical protein
MSDRETLNRLAVLLSDNPGYAFCNDCLAKRLELKLSVVWTAALELAESPDFEVDVGICSHCLDQIESVAHVRWIEKAAPPPGPTAKPRIRFAPPGSDA